jgi:methionine sulfoxide reductase heme-binding subunit
MPTAMTLALSSPSSASALWFLSRGSGVVSLILLTAVLLLGVLTRAGRALPASPRFVTADLHRNLSLLAVTVLVVHIATAVADPYAPIRLVDAFVPFVSAYRPIWLGLGALALDLLLALIVTSLLRGHIGRRTWRAIHWTAYAVWPLALVHGFGTGTDAGRVWLLGVAAIAAAIVIAMLLWRIFWVGEASRGRRVGGSLAVVAVPLAMLGWMTTGPLAPHWAARAGTPAALLTGSSGPVVSDSSTRSTRTVPRGTVRFTGRTQVRQVPGQRTLIFAATLGSGSERSLRIVLSGAPSAGGGIALSKGWVTYRRGTLTYAGPVTVLAGSRIESTLTGPAGQVRMTAELSGASTGKFAGVARFT